MKTLMIMVTILEMIQTFKMKTLTDLYEDYKSNEWVVDNIELKK